MVTLSEVATDVRTVSLDIFDLTGKRVVARSIPVQDGSVNIALALGQTLADGIYLVHLTAGNKRFTERLIVQH
jgi:hypothetical protein